MATRDPAYWRRAGLQMGAERAQLDALSGRPQDPDQLWIPDDVPAAYAEALRQGYRATISGTAIEEL